jgi:hypothetical protein
LTLPDDTIQDLHRVHHDIGWAIVKLLEAAKPMSAPAAPEEQPDVELVDVGERRALIVINLEACRILPGVTIIPFRGNRAFLALDAGRGMSDLELAVIDRLGDPLIESRERRGLMTIRTQLAAWRRDRQLRLHTRAIIVIERLGQAPSEGQGGGARRPAPKHSTVASSWPRQPKKTHAETRRTQRNLPGRPTSARRRMGVAP